MKKLSFILYLLFFTVMSSWCVDVTITMNAVSPFMRLTKQVSGEPIETDESNNKIYTFSTDPGKYVLTALATDTTTINGTIELDITDSNNSFSILTLTAYATNSSWQVETDYTIHFSVISREGKEMVVTGGQSVTAGRICFLALSGNTYFCDFIPSTEHSAEGYTTLYKTATVTFNNTISGKIPLTSAVKVITPTDANVFVGRKTAHFVPFIEELPVEVKNSGNTKIYYYALAQSGQYNYRVSRQGGLTQAGIFTAGKSEQDTIILSFDETDFSAKSPQWINRDVNSNDGYNVADIFLNINEREHLKLAINDTFDLLPLRNWEIINTTTANYFIEPDYHYAVTDLSGNISSDVIMIDSVGTLHAIGEGTAIVTVTYDAIRVNQYSDNTASGMVGGEYWSALWPENTGVFVVTVGGNESGIVSNTLINPTNEVKYKLAGNSYDADFDVFYFIDSIGYYDYTFAPTNVQNVEIAYPTISETGVIYNGFSQEGVSFNTTTNEYTIKIKKGRQIIKLSNTTGTEYQVMVGKPVHVGMKVGGRSHNGVFQPGDDITIQFSGLFHPVNKLAGIHNFTATTTYQITPAGVISSKTNQYKFASTPDAQAVIVSIPDTFDITAVNKKYDLQDGVIKISNFGDPIGNHRNTSKRTGRGANFTAIQQQAVFGTLPSISLPLRERIESELTILVSSNEADIKLFDYKGNEITPYENNKYKVTTANYTCVVSKKGFHTNKRIISMPSDGVSHTEIIELEAIDANDTGWDGITTTYEPDTNANGAYIICSGYHLAWFAQQVALGKYTISAELHNDISLSNYPWMPIGGNTATKSFHGNFDGKGYVVSGLYIDTTLTHQGLFGYTSDDTIANIIVEGSVHSTKEYVAGLIAYSNNTTIKNCVSRVRVVGKQYVAGIAGYCAGTTLIDRCGNEHNIQTSSNYVGGITAYIAGISQIQNCYNVGSINGHTGYVGGIVGRVNKDEAVVENVYNTGKILNENNSVYVGAIRGSNDKGQFAKLYASTAYFTDTNTTEEDYVQTTILDSLTFISGEACFIMDTPFVQTIGHDIFPNFTGDTVYQHTVNNITYYSNFKELKKNRVADFENETDGIHLSDENQYWYGEQPLTSGVNEWSSGDFSFYTYNDDQYGTPYYYAFVVSNDTNRISSGYTYLYRSVSGGAYEGDNFAIWSSDYYGSNGIALAYPDTVPGFFVNNNAYTLNSMENGDGYAKKFSEEDFLYLLCIGKLRDSITDTISVTLADNGKYISQWTYIDLGGLGIVDTIYFTMVGSDNSQFGLNTPAYFCLDNFGQTKPANYVTPDMTAFKTKTDNILTTSTEPVTSGKIKKRIQNNTVYIQIGTCIYNILGIPVFSR